MALPSCYDTVLPFQPSAEAFVLRIKCFLLIYETSSCYLLSATSLIITNVIRSSRSVAQLLNGRVNWKNSSRTGGGMSNASDILIVPTIIQTGSLHFAEVSTDGTAQDVIDLLLAIEGLKGEVLGDLEDFGWKLQRLRMERSGRPWEEDELLALGDGQD